MLFFVFGHRRSNTHFEQCLRAFYRIFSQIHETESEDSIPAASTIFLCFNGWVLGVPEPLFGPENCEIFPTTSVTVPRAIPVVLLGSSQPTASRSIAISRPCWAAVLGRDRVLSVPVTLVGRARQWTARPLPPSSVTFLRKGGISGGALSETKHSRRVRKCDNCHLFGSMYCIFIIYDHFLCRN